MPAVGQWVALSVLDYSLFVNLTVAGGGTQAEVGTHLAFYGNWMDFKGKHKCILARAYLSCLHTWLSLLHLSKEGNTQVKFSARIWHFLPRE